MMKILAAVSLLALVGCSGRIQQCRYEAGPEPDEFAAHAFGLLGVLAVVADPERRAWNTRVRDCLDRDTQHAGP